MAKAVPSGQTNQLDISGKYGTYLLEQNLLGVSDYLVGPAILGIMDPEVYKKLVVGGEAAVLRIRIHGKEIWKMMLVEFLEFISQGDIVVKLPQMSKRMLCQFDCSLKKTLSLHLHPTPPGNELNIAAESGSWWIDYIGPLLLTMTDRFLKTMEAIEPQWKYTNGSPSKEGCSNTGISEKAATYCDTPHPNKRLMAKHTYILSWDFLVVGTPVPCLATRVDLSSDSFVLRKKANPDNKAIFV
ncbi:hypothetical protein Tco_1056239 [Tanacetum coccineum]|uniref:Uncharacterized protein n=1 Tax=Tanacetum coccineum TaxID=301880 RepID=A0ABQ5H3Q1_9ASTR